ncbi:hypothetical protein HDU85_001445 [Gaertneriomyces sp. JEL0708]|nr:hypothetical protein HDU85_001445 [Gaertneriomyces sp. JEL0708]
MGISAIKFTPDGIAFWNVTTAKAVTYTGIFAVAVWTLTWLLISQLRRVRSAWQLQEEGQVKIATLAISGRVPELSLLTQKTTRKCGLLATLLLSAYLIERACDFVLINATTAHENCGIQRQENVQSRLVSMFGAQFFNHSGYTTAIEKLYTSAKVPIGDIPKVVIHDKQWVYTPDLSAGSISCTPVETRFEFRVNVSLGLRSNAFAIADFAAEGKGTGAIPVNALQADVPYASIRFDLRTGRYMQPCAVDPAANCLTHLDVHYLASWPESATSFKVLLINTYDRMSTPLNLGRLDGQDVRVPYTTPAVVPAQLCQVKFTDPLVISRWGEMNIQYVDRFATFLSDRLTREWNNNVRAAIDLSQEPRKPQTNPVALLTQLMLTVGTDLKADDFVTTASFAVPCSILSYWGALILLVPLVINIGLLAYLLHVFSMTGRSLLTTIGLIPVSAPEWAGLAIVEAGVTARGKEGYTEVFEQNCDVLLVKDGDGVKIFKDSNAYGPVHVAMSGDDGTIYEKC